MCPQLDVRLFVVCVALVLLPKKLIESCSTICFFGGSQNVTWISKWITVNVCLLVILFRKGVAKAQKFLKCENGIK